MSFQFVHTKLEIILSHAPWPEADALIVPTNDYLWMATGSALETKLAAGEEVETEAVRQGPIALGEIVATGAGGLALKRIIHAAFTGQDLEVEPAAGAEALVRGLALAARHGDARVLIHSILGCARHARPDLLDLPLARLVEHLLDDPPLQKVYLLARDEGERVILHEKVIRIIQTQH